MRVHDNVKYGTGLLGINRRNHQQDSKNMQYKSHNNCIIQQYNNTHNIILKTKN